MCTHLLLGDDVGGVVAVDVVRVSAAALLVFADFAPDFLPFGVLVDAAAGFASTECTVTTQSGGCTIEQRCDNGDNSKQGDSSWETYAPGTMGCFGGVYNENVPPCRLLRLTGVKACGPMS